MMTTATTWEDKEPKEVVELKKLFWWCGSKTYTLQSTLFRDGNNEDELLEMLEKSPWLASRKFSVSHKQQQQQQQQQKRSLLYHVCKSQCSTKVVRRVVLLFPEAASFNEDNGHPSALALLLAPHRAMNRVESMELMELVGYVGTICPEAFSRTNAAGETPELNLKIHLTSRAFSVLQKYPVLLKHCSSLAVYCETQPGESVPGQVCAIIHGNHRFGEVCGQECHHKLLSMLWNKRKIKAVSQLHLRMSSHDPDFAIRFTNESAGAVVLQTKNIHSENSRLLSLLQDLMGKQPSIEHVKISVVRGYQGSLSRLLQSTKACNVDTVTVSDTRDKSEELDGVLEQLKGKPALNCVSMCINAPVVTRAPSLVGLDRLQTLVLELKSAGNILVDPLVQLIQISCNLTRVDVRGCDITDPTELLHAAGESKSVVHFGCEVSHPDHLQILLRYLKKSNTSMTIVKTEPIRPSTFGYFSMPNLSMSGRILRFGTDTQLLDMKTLLGTIHYYCFLNHMGRGRLRTEDVTKSDFVKALGDLEADGCLGDFFHLMYVHDRKTTLRDCSVNLLYELLRENPAIWCRD